MAMEYFIDELGFGGQKTSHGSTFSSGEAQTRAEDLRRRTGNTVTVTPHLIPINQIEQLNVSGEPEIQPITAQELYEEVHGMGAKLDDQNYRTRLIFQLVSEAANNTLESYQSGLIYGGAVESGKDLII